MEGTFVSSRSYKLSKNLSGKTASLVPVLAFAVFQLISFVLPVQAWAGGSLSNAPGVSAADVTIFPSNPQLQLQAGSSAGTTLSILTDARILLSYNVAAQGSRSGVSFVFSNSSPLPFGSRLTLGIQGRIKSLKVNLLDVNGRADSFTLLNVSASEELFWSIPASRVRPQVDKNRIKQIDLCVLRSSTFRTIRTGAVRIRIGGLRPGPNAPVITSQVPSATRQSSLIVSGTKEAHTALLINGAASGTDVHSTAWWTTLELPNDGSHTFTFNARNSLFQLSPPVSLTILRDTQAPSGSLEINGGASYTAQAAVTLFLNANDGAGSGVDQVSVSADPATLTSTQPYQPTVTFTLPPHDGPKQVYAKFYDRAGNQSPVYSQSILLDTTLPTGSISIESDRAYTRTLSVSLTLTQADATSGPDSMHLKVGTGNWTAWEPVTSSKTIDLAPVDGPQTVFYQVKDRAGLLSTELSDSIILDTVGPRIEFLSPTLTNEPDYLLRYTVDGSEKTKACTLTEGENTLGVTETDPAGNSTTASFKVALDTIPPAIRLLSPSLTNRSDYVLRYTVDAVEKTRNVTLTEGDNDLSVTESDPAGNVTTATLKVTLDTVPPAILFKSSTLTNTPHYVLRYTADAIEKSMEFSLSEGLNELSVTETDEAGNQTSASLKVTLDTLPPKIEFLSATLTNVPDYTLTYLVDGAEKSKQVTLAEGDNSLSITETDPAGNSATATYAVILDTVPPEIVFLSNPLINQPDYTLVYTADGTEKSKRLTLTEGENSLEVSESDEAGNSTTASYSVTLDTVPPQIKFLSATLTNNPDYTLTYLVDGAEKSKQVTLAEGDNSLSVTETDPADNSATATYAVILDTVPPEIVFLSNPLTHKADYTLVYKVDGAEKSKDSTLAEGENTLSVTESDEAGNGATASFVVTLDTVPPAVEFLSNSLTNQPEYLLSYTVDGAEKTKNLTLSEGDNDLTVTETDAAGNSASATFRVTLDTIAPVISFLSPPLTDQPDYTLIYTADSAEKQKQVSLEEGENTLSVTETDAAGNETTTSYKVTLDTTPPQILAVSPPEANRFLDGDRATFSVETAAEPGLQYRALLDGTEEVPWQASASLELNFRGGPSEQTLTLEVKDRLERRTAHGRRVFVYRRPPQPAP